MSNTTKAFRGEILHFLSDPAKDNEQSYQYFADGILVVTNGLVESVGFACDILTTLAEDVVVKKHDNGLLIPGFVDTHIHYPQTQMIGSYGEQLLEWLESYTFPTESQFGDINFAKPRAEFFLDQLLTNGTTTALVFGTVHPESVDAFFTQAEQLNVRMICGKVMMDRNAPDNLTDTPQQSYDESKALIEKWHGKGRLHYAVTPRFAPTSTSEQLNKAGQLLQEYPDVFMHTHLSENKNECAWVNDLFPECKNYLDVYDQHGLLSKRSIFAHGIHLCDDEYQRLSDTDSALSYCPTSNLFLGSGLFNLNKAQEFDIDVGLGTDVGAGTSFSQLQSLNEAYKIQQLRGEKLTSLKSFYLATLGGAKALDLDDKIGNFSKGKEADFIVLDYQSTDLMRVRMNNAKDIIERLFVLSTLGDDRAVSKTYVMGELAHDRENKKISAL
ncbi:guanine deaminase [Pseudoalteromonas denitrificans]|uniref:Guanine deaminase n=1 Tax=Pseudoalteromonas denitrificans DSM 6059 TaxID=1123010 RepID=A0A1I1L6H6_9GAMM|nr:guanine deaminase [Pseudoalteromonas denitrificans]SFC68667.1 guanine deaminase [Pseudoalteromonas denitrificans DSM 6059]